MSDPASGFVPLNADLSNIQEFIPSLFLDTVRSTDAVIKSVEDKKLFHSFTDDESRRLILTSWLAAWQQSQGDKADETAYGRCPETDRTIIGQLAAYMKSNGLHLCIPQLAWTGKRKKDTDLYVYENKKYEKQKFYDKSDGWYYGEIDSSGQPAAGDYKLPTVANFLYHLFYGAHFVVPSAPDDNKQPSNVQNLYTSITSTFQTVTLPGTPPLSYLDTGDWRIAVISSHYVLNDWWGHQWAVNQSGLNWLTITDNQEPTYNPLICSLLIGKTADSNPNTFLQLEGWQEKKYSKGDWHGKDFDASTKTLWNFSTYGACVYSEKRCAPLFLAADSFSLDLQDNTHMPHYVGAGSPQNWMHTELLQLP